MQLLDVSPPYHGRGVGKKRVIGFCRTRATLLRGVVHNVSQEGYAPKWCTFISSGADAKNY